ncbi:OST-HTH/LOTUS domain-containing protein [Sphingobium yanoikuyae]|uniref:OST-HTH/LOTUS domain-containing protein n=1 Tax=Sphingobium yanoikuyae TaxID=13690 RepID=UPI0023546BB7|nr:OST-HTH/LOTUS domain-containing protein [Sphingobium yanoikuyae]
MKKPPTAAVPLIRTALAQLDDLDSWHSLGAVGSRLNVLLSDFDPRTYGCSKLLSLIEKSGAFNVRRDDLRVYIRPKKD